MENTALTRRILHVDMDAFYASVEQRDRPELKGKPVIVGGSRRGVVSTASYEARRFGVHSAMPIFQAKRLCPQAIFLPVRMARYKEVSRIVMETLREISPVVEPVSIDEAYVDISGTELLHGNAELVGLGVKRRILDLTQLTCSVGIAPNKFLAKIASEKMKPDGLTIVLESEVKSFLGSLPVGKIPGIGKKTSEVLRNLGVRTIADVAGLAASFWIGRLGKTGAKIYERSQGIDTSPVVPDSEPKSSSAEDTFPEDTDRVPELEKWLWTQSESVGRDLRRTGCRGRTITIKIKFSDFKIVTRSKTLAEPTDCTQLIFNTAVGLLQQVRLPRKVRLIGVGVSNFSGLSRQTAIFSDPVLARHHFLDRAVDVIRDKYGARAVQRGRTFDREASAEGEDDPSK